jgi:hypothetical protein
MSSLSSKGTWSSFELAGRADLEVVAGAPGPLERLDLAHEDAVHQGAGGVGRVGAVGLQAAGAPVGGRAAVARVLDALEHVGPLEAVVAGQLFG